MSYWREIRKNYYNEEENYISIDGWQTADDNEAGQVIAQVYPEHVAWHDNGSRLDKEVLAAIHEAQRELSETDYFRKVVDWLDTHPSVSVQVHADVLKRCCDWLVDGGMRNSDYLKSQYFYLKNLERKLEK